ncbi:hypothetical protein DVS77_27900 [Mycolicibacterium moriokaense]|nr:hypothetical protein DVS77_27900 [Mycolicibacterium moriokaense]
MVAETARRIPDQVGGLVYVGALVPVPGANAAGIVFGHDLPTDEPRTTTQERAKLFFASGMTEQQWDILWQQFVPESPLLWNARLQGHSAAVPTTYVSLADDVGVPPEVCRTHGRQPRNRRTAHSASDWAHCRDDEARRTCKRN